MLVRFRCGNCEHFPFTLTQCRTCSCSCSYCFVYRIASCSAIYVGPSLGSLHSLNANFVNLLGLLLAFQKCDRAALASCFPKLEGSLRLCLAVPATGSASCSLFTAVVALPQVWPPLQMFSLGISRLTCTCSSICKHAFQGRRVVLFQWSDLLHKISVLRILLTRYSSIFIHLYQASDKYS